MAFNPFFGWTEDQLLAALSEAQAELASGSQLQSANSGDVASSRRVQVSALPRMRLIGDALTALDDDTYPLGFTAAPTRTTATNGIVVPLSSETA